MDQNEKKQAVAKAAIDYVEADSIVGVGTGSTVNFFIEELGKIKHKIEGAVSSSEASTERLKAFGQTTPKVVLSRYAFKSVSLSHQL